MSFCMTIAKWRGVPEFQQDCYRKGSLCDLTLFASLEDEPETEVSLEKMFRDGDPTPCEKILCHKLVIASRSNFLRDECSGSLIKEKKFENLRFDQLKMWIDAMYFGILVAKYSDLPALLSTAKKLQMNEEGLMALSSAINQSHDNTDVPIMDAKVLVDLIEKLHQFSVESSKDPQENNKYKFAANALAVHLASYCSSLVEAPPGLNYICWKYVLEVLGRDFGLSGSEEFDYQVEDEDIWRTFTVAADREGETDSVDTTGDQRSRNSWSVKISKSQVIQNFAKWTTSQEISLAMKECVDAMAKIDLADGPRLCALKEFCGRPGLEIVKLWLFSMGPRDQSNQSATFTSTLSEPASSPAGSDAAPSRKRSHPSRNTTCQAQKRPVPRGARTTQQVPSTAPPKQTSRRGRPAGRRGGR